MPLYSLQSFTMQYVYRPAKTVEEINNMMSADGQKTLKCR